MMIVRAAGRRRRAHLLAASFSQLNLPWLAPAQLRWLASHNAGPALSTQRPRRRSTGRDRRDSASLRRLATSADSVRQPLDASYDDPMLSEQRHTSWAWQGNARSGSVYMQPLGKPIVLETATRNAPPTLSVQPGVHGTPTELLQHMHTCLRIGRLSRARAIIQRLEKEPLVTAAQLTHAHAVYLEGSLNSVRSHLEGSDEAQSAFEEMQQWFEQRFQGKDVGVSGQMLVHMVSGAIHALNGSARDECITKYIQIGSEIDEDVYDEVLFSDEYDDAEFDILSNVTGVAPPAELDTDSQGLGAKHEHTSHIDTHGHRRRIDRISLPEVLATPQTGRGLSDIKKVLDPLRDIAASSAEAPIAEQQAVAMERQLLLEEQSAEIAIEKWRSADAELKKLGIRTALQTRSVSALMWQWYSKLLPVLQQEIELGKKALDGNDKSKNSEYAERLEAAPYLEMLPAEKLTACTILFVLTHLTRAKSRSHEDFEQETRLANMVELLGGFIEDECNVQPSKIVSRVSSRSRTTRSRPSSSRRRFASQAASQPHKTQDLKERIKDWSSVTKARVGSFLLRKLMENAQLPVTREHIRTKQRVTQLQPALLHRVKYKLGRRQGLIVPNPALVHKLLSEPVPSILAKRTPMIVEPRPWEGWKEGGYIRYENPIMRVPSTSTGCQEYFIAAHNQGDLGQLYAGLNALSKVPWYVNQDVLKVQVEAWNSGEPVGNFAPLHPDIPTPPEPGPSADQETRHRWLREVREVENKKSGFHSQRCFQNLQLETARAMVNETLYLPHNIDFRGRAYPIPPYFNHMGADNVRALLVFADGKELGEEGLRWLKIHLANVAGYDKASLQEREAFTMAHLDDIRDTVKDPLGGRQWWRKAEDAWQTLAACFELVHALDSPDPVKFVSHLPVQQDGTCNGLQHYAALGGDRAGATHVNLEPGERPADVYTAVLDGVNMEINRDAAAGHPIAKFLQGQMIRKVVKQPVMTNVYGVTFYGAQAQVRKQLVDLFPGLRRSDEINHTNMSTYITQKIFTSLGSMFTGAQAIQDWLGQCADRISRCLTAEQIAQLCESEPVPVKKNPRARSIKKAKEERQDEVLLSLNQDGTTSSRALVAQDTSARRSFSKLFKSTVVWTTPLGLPVVQPYRSAGNVNIRSALQDLAIQEPQLWDPVSRRKQLQAFAPNFIHSLDATHMLLSAIKCNEVGITFASIHDSFWTHASDVSQMSILLRDAFVAMHSDDIIGRLHEEFATRYKNALYMAEVYGNSSSAKKIRAWRKDNPQHAKTRLGEVKLEIERIRLLKSSDAAERQRGEAMVTPASILDATNDEGLFQPVMMMHDQALGAIPGQKSKQGEQPASEMLELEEDEEEESGNARKIKATGAKLSVWREMKFPDVPKKGDFDVRRLRESKYFFS